MQKPRCTGNNISRRLKLDEIVSFTTSVSNRRCDIANDFNYSFGKIISPEQTILHLNYFVISYQFEYIHVQDNEKRNEKNSST